LPVASGAIIRRDPLAAESEGDRPVALRPALGVRELERGRWLRRFLGKPRIFSGVDDSSPR